MSDASLYDTDYVAWTEAQAEALRAHGRGGNAIDYELLAEEIEDMGKSEIHACESLIEQILLHFAKIAYLGDPENRGHWAGEIVGFRTTLRRRLSPSIKARVIRDWESYWDDARARLEITYDLKTRGVALPPTCPWTFDDVTGRGVNWLPDLPTTR